jgi:hypothetical protein
MQPPDEFFNLHRERAKELLAIHLPEVQLDIIDADIPKAFVTGSSHISLSTTLLLVMVNVFFRMLTSPRILPGNGLQGDSPDNFVPFPGQLPNRLQDILDTADDSIQPMSHERALLSKTLADFAFDFLVLQLAYQSRLQGVASPPLEEGTSNRHYQRILTSDHQAFLTGINSTSATAKSAGNLQKTSKDQEAGELHLFFFAVGILFFILEPILKLPVAVRMVHSQELLSRHLDNAQIKTQQTAFNEAILAHGEITHKPPILDGFNGVLNPDSRMILKNLFH